MSYHTTDPAIEALVGLCVLAAIGLILLSAAGFGAFESYEVLHRFLHHH